jgi:hypothetical protein
VASLRKLGGCKRLLDEGHVSEIGQRLEHRDIEIEIVLCGFSGWVEGLPQHRDELRRPPPIGEAGAADPAVATIAALIRIEVQDDGHQVGPGIDAKPPDRHLSACSPAAAIADRSNDYLDDGPPGADRARASDAPILIGPEFAPPFPGALGCHPAHHEGISRLSPRERGQKSGWSACGIGATS